MLLETPGEGTTLMCFIARVRDTRTVRTGPRMRFVLEPSIGVRTVEKSHMATITHRCNHNGSGCDQVLTVLHMSDSGLDEATRDGEDMKQKKTEETDDKNGT